jgi:PAS domain S-box-containing protein
MDPKGVILDWSARAEAAFGWSRDEVLGRGLIEVLAPLRHQTPTARSWPTPGPGSEPPAERQSSQLMAMRKDGVEIPIEVSLAAFGEADAPLFLGFIRDVTDRVEVHERLAASEARFRAAIGAVDGILWTNDASGRMVGDQPGWAGLTGQTPTSTRASAGPTRSIPTTPSRRSRPGTRPSRGAVPSPSSIGCVATTGSGATFASAPSPSWRPTARSANGSASIPTSPSASGPRNACARARPGSGPWPIPRRPRSG